MVCPYRVYYAGQIAINAVVGQLSRKSVDILSGELAQTFITKAAPILPGHTFTLPVSQSNCGTVAMPNIITPALKPLATGRALTQLMIRH